MSADLLGDDYTAEDLARLNDRLSSVRERIRRAGGDPNRIRVVAVTKGFGLAAVRAALAAGLSAIGENYAEELVTKAQRLAVLDPDAEVAWHFLGAVQRNKVGRLAPHVRRYEGVDRLEEGERIARLAPGTSVLVEVNLTGRAGRGGVRPEEVAGLVAALRRLALSVDGLMTVAPPGDEAASRAGFARVAGLVAELGLAEASMGMSDDFEWAVAAGATTLRLGRVLFGERPESALAAGATGPEAGPAPHQGGHGAGAGEMSE